MSGADQNNLEATAKRLSQTLLDGFSRQVLLGAIRVAMDEGNPIRLNLFAAAVRELFGHTLKKLAPDADVMACSWYLAEPGQTGPTRRQRAKFATQGGLTDAFVSKANVDVQDLHDEAIYAVSELNKYTHVRPGVIVGDQGEINQFVVDALSALEGLFESFERCREAVIDALYDNIDREVVDTFISETMEGIDELATHHTIEEVYIEELAIAGLDARFIHFKANGSLGVELQWGSSSDVRRGEGASMQQTFPFEITMVAPLDNIQAFEQVQYTVDTRTWYGE